MFQLKPLILAAAVAATPLLAGGEASADHSYRRPGCDYGYSRYVPTYRSGYASRYSSFRSPLFVPSVPPRYGVGISPRYGFGVPGYRSGYSGFGYGRPFGYPGSAYGRSGFSLYIGR